MNKTEYRSFKLQITKNEETRDIFGDDGLIRGHAIVFDNKSHDLGVFREIVEREALTHTLSDGHNIFALWAHDYDQPPVGSTGSGKLSLRADDTGLYFELDPSRMTDQQRDAIRDGDMRMSFGFHAIDQEWLDLDKDEATRILKRIDLVEISFVINPAYPDTTAALRSLSEAKSDINAAIEEPIINTSGEQRELLIAHLDILEAVIKSESTSI